MQCTSTFCMQIYGREKKTGSKVCTTQGLYQEEKEKLITIFLTCLKQGSVIPHFVCRYTEQTKKIRLQLLSNWSNYERLSAHYINLLCKMCKERQRLILFTILDTEDKTK